MKNTDAIHSVVKQPPMGERASKYLAVETVSSGVVNGILNFAAAYALFHGRSVVPATGPRSLLMDSIGETFLVTALSVLVPSLIARQRRRAGTLPVSGNRRAIPRGNLYVRAIVIGLIFTVVLVPCNRFLLPWIFPSGVTFRNVLLFKTVYGTVLGSIATWMAVRRALHETD